MVTGEMLERAQKLWLLVVSIVPRMLRGILFSGIDWWAELFNCLTLAALLD